MDEIKAQRVRKAIVSRPDSGSARLDEGWMDLTRGARVELTSEDAGHPIESALVPGMEPGWRAADPGRQMVRVIFDEPVRIRRILVEIHEELHTRTQQLVIRSLGHDGTVREVVRQGYNFSPPGTTQEREDYRVELDGVAGLELDILPDVSGGEAHASLRRLQLA